MTPNQFLEKFFPDWFDRYHRRPIWDPISIERQMTRFFEEHGRPPYTNELYNRNGLPTGTTFLRHMKEQPTAYCLRVYTDYFTTRQEERKQFILESYESWIRRNLRHPGFVEIQQDRLPSSAAIKTSFHCTASEFLRQQFPEYPGFTHSAREENPEDVGPEEPGQGMNMTL